MSKDRIFSPSPDTINQLCTGIVELFLKSRYPSQQFLSAHTDYRQLARQLPCIENIEIDPVLQSKGLYYGLVDALSKAPGITAVVIGSVENIRLAASMAQKSQQSGSGWSLYPAAWSPFFCFSTTGFALEEGDNPFLHDTTGLQDKSAYRVTAFTQFRNLRLCY